jgi:hypothetical protein
MKMIFNKNKLFKACLAILAMSILVSESYAQITFSNDWYGGRKRSDRAMAVNSDENVSNYHKSLMIEKLIEIKSDYLVKFFFIQIMNANFILEKWKI